MGFVKSAWRLLMVVKDGLVLLFLLMFFGLLFAALSAIKAPVETKKGALLISLDGTVAEQPEGDDPLSLLGQKSSVHEFALRDVVRAIETAANDKSVPAIVIDMSRFLGTGQVSAQRIGTAIDKARKAGKPVLTYALAYTDDGYAIASHASEIWLNPQGLVALTGPGGSNLYYKGLMDKLGVTAHVYRVGTYKSFVEPYIRSDQSPAAKQASQALVSSLWNNWLDAVSHARPSANVRGYAANPLIAAQRFGGDAAKAAITLKMVDHLGDEFAFGDRIAKFGDAESDGGPGNFASVDMADYLKLHPASKDAGKVGVVTVAGEIQDGEAEAGTAGAETIATLITDALSDDSIKALVVRVDSPGGSVTAAERIRQSVLQARKAGLPVVISMGDVAASGGYWISTAGQKIYAQPSTITGSIGVFGIIPSFEGTLGKLGITTDGVKATPLSGEPDVMGGISPQFDELAQAEVTNTYQQFVSLVAKARKIPLAQAEKIAEGRVWDGGTAHQLRLVDSFGTLDDAVADAARLAKLSGTAATARYLDPKPDALARVLASFQGEARVSARPQPIGWLAIQGWRQRTAMTNALTDAAAIVGKSGVMASCMECQGFGMRTARAPTATPDANLLMRLAHWMQW